jgi:hypothetical protein
MGVDSRGPDASLRPVVVVVAATVLVGAATSLLVGWGAKPAVNTFVEINAPAQSLMSVLLPLSGIMLVRRLAPEGGRGVRWTLARAAGCAIIVAAVGVAASAGVAAAVPAATGRWGHAPTAVLGSLLVQLVAQSVGTALGLLVRRTAVAFLATVVLPLGLWFLLGVVPAATPAQAWVTPYAAATRLLSGEVGPVGWLEWLVMAALWTVALNVIALRAASSSSGHRPGDVR